MAKKNPSIALLLGLPKKGGGNGPRGMCGDEMEEDDEMSDELPGGLLDAVAMLREAKSDEEAAQAFRDAVRLAME